MITDAQIAAFLENKGRAGEQPPDPEYCLHCLDVLYGPRDECPCLPTEPPVEEYDVWGDR